MTREASESSGSLPLPLTAGLWRILVVDDNDESRRELCRQLGERGWQVESARTLRAALAIAPRQVPHVIITELRLPDVRGYRFAHEYRCVVPEVVAIIAVTRITPLVETARGAGFDEVLAKPVDLETLDARIRAVLQTRSRR